MAPAAFNPRLKDKRRQDVPSFVLLDIRSHNTGGPNATTAKSKTSTGMPIQVTLCAVPPPDLSYLHVHCPGLEVDYKDVSQVPKVISADANLVLLRVPRDRMAGLFTSHNDYFVYNVHPPKLDFLPNPYPDEFNDKDIAILSCGKDNYVVAALQLRPPSDFTFTLHLYHSGPDGKRWISRGVFVEEPQRDSVCPIPDSGHPAQSHMYHLTTKVIVLGGPKGTIGWVDLWRGILLCDVLEDSPKVRDIPLPLPAKGNWDKFLIGCPYYSRDIVVNQSKDTIKYIEMEITKPTKVTRGSSKSDYDSYHEWIRRRELPQSYSLIPGSWKATTWSMPIPVTSWDSWQCRCTILSEDIDLPAENTRHYELLHELIRSSDEDDKAIEPTLSLGCLHMAYPTMSTADDDDDGGDTVYLLSKGTSFRSLEMGVAIDVKAGTLQGVAKLGMKRNIIFLRCCLGSGISKHIKAKGISINQHEEEGHGKLDMSDAVSTSNMDCGLLK